MTFSGESVLVDQVTVYRIHCSECGAIDYKPSEDDAERHASDHRLAHRFMESHGARRRPKKKEK